MLADRPELEPSNIARVFKFLEYHVHFTEEDTAGMAQRITRDRDSCQRRKKSATTTSRSMPNEEEMGDFRREGRRRVKYGDAQSNEMMRVSHLLRSFHIDLITAMHPLLFHPPSEGRIPRGQIPMQREYGWWCVWAGKGGVLCKNRVVREYKPPSREQLEERKRRGKFRPVELAINAL